MQKIVKQKMITRFFRFFSETLIIFASNKRINNEYKP
ncbi:unknown [Prevotella sp. CAG:1185]|nr:unknown [Prevotella sp. CAG:1185]